jgi:hypothetical protein
MSDDAGEALRVLRGIWSAQGQGTADLDHVHGKGGHCKRMEGVGFDDFDGTEDELRTAWRARLEREGKLTADGATVADLVLGPEHAH